MIVLSAAPISYFSSLFIFGAGTSFLGDEGIDI
jgi:hypothetical protein